LERADEVSDQRLIIAVSDHHSALTEHWLDALFSEIEATIRLVNLKNKHTWVEDPVRLFLHHRNGIIRQMVLQDLWRDNAGNSGWIFPLSLSWQFRAPTTGTVLILLFSTAETCPNQMPRFTRIAGRIRVMGGHDSVDQTTQQAPQTQEYPLTIWALWYTISLFCKQMKQ